MRLFSLILLLLLTSRGYAQTQDDTLKGFWGISFGVPDSEALKITGGRSLTPYSKKSENGLTKITFKNVRFSGQTADWVLLYFVNNKFYEGTIFYYDIKLPYIQETFNNIKIPLDNKYFPSKSVPEFKLPYKEGDGQEETAISTGYGVLNAYWFFKQNTIALRTYNDTDNKQTNIKLIYQDTDLENEAVKISGRHSDY